MPIDTTGQPSYVTTLLDWGLPTAISWTGNEGVAANLTYSFDSSLNGRGYTSNMSDFGAAEEAAAREIMELWANVANITFSESNSNPDIVYGERNLSVGTAGTTEISYFPSLSLLNYADVYYDDSGINPGQSGYHTIVHEIGHALGLGHPDDNGYNPNYSLDETAMSYNAGDVATAGASSWASGPMIYDIAAIQFLYGANRSFNAGDTIYNASNLEGITTVWDAGGIDTFDASSETSATSIDLRGGIDSFSDLGFADVAIAFDPLNASGVVDIENAIGGAGNDTIFGSNIDNQLTGNAGNDSLFGYNGDDTLLGGLGSDRLYGGGNNDQLDGGDDNDRIYGQSGDDTLLGGAGNDLIRGNDGDDSIDGGSGIDKLFGSDGNDTVRGGADKDYLYGEDGNDILIGNEGIDILTGGAGADLFTFTAISDSYYSAAGSFRDYITDFELGIDAFDMRGLGFSGIAESGYTDVGEVRFSYSSASNLTYVRSDQTEFQFAIKGQFNTTLTSDSFLFNVDDVFTIAGDNILGTAGDDFLVGGTYDDTIDGAAGRDRMTGAEGADIFVFSDASHSFKNSTTNATDGILDFEIGSDVIDVSALDYIGLGAVTDAQGVLYVTYSSASDRSYVRDRYSDFEFYLDGDYTLSLSDDDFLF